MKKHLDSTSAIHYQLKENHRGAVAERACKIMSENIEQIGNVDDWAKLAGISSRWLGICTNSHFSKPPGTLLKKERYKKIRAVIERHPEATAAFVAAHAAPHWNEKNLYNFLSAYHNTNFTRLRTEILRGGKASFNKKNR